jgi:tetratricopeptide (TPR) repeat protein
MPRKRRRTTDTSRRSPAQLVIDAPGGLGTAQPTASSATFLRPGLAIFAVAAGLRLLNIWQLRASPFFTTLMGDARAYDQWAVRLASGDWIGRDVFYQSPLYPYALGVVYAAVGRDLVVVRVIQALLGAASCVLLARATASFVSRRAGIVAGFILALYAPAIFLDGLIQKSVLDVFLVCTALWILSGLATGGDAPGHSDGRTAFGWRGRPIVWAGALGVVCGALMLTRENALVLAAVLLVWLIASGVGDPRRRVALPLVFVAGLACALAPVTARNWMVGGGLAITTAQFGPNLYIGNNANADGSYMALREGRGDPAFEREDATAIAERSVGRPLSPGDVSGFWRDRALDFIRAQPGPWLALTGRKVMLFLNDAELIDTEAQESHAQWSWPLRLTSGIGRFGVLLPLAAFGLIVLGPLSPALRLVLALAVGYVASVVVFFVVARYRYPLIPLLIVFAAAGFTTTRTLATAGSWRRFAAAGIPLALAACTFWPTLSSAEMRAITETNLGAARQKERRYDEAIHHYRRAIADNPHYAPAHNNLGVALRELGRLDDAAVAYREALSLQPDFKEVHYNLGTVLLEQGQTAAALDHFLNGREAIPDTAVANYNFGVALAAGRHPEAPAYLRRATILAPRNADTHFALASALVSADAPAEAEPAFRAALTLAPDRAEIHNGLGVALAAQGQFDAAIREFERALVLNPAFPEAQRYLAAARQARAK